MLKMVQRLWGEEAGFVVSSELVLIATVLVLGLVVGLTTVRDQVTQELGDVAAAISDVNQSYSMSGITGHHSSSSGSLFDDQVDDCDANGDPANAEPACIEICDVAATVGEG